MDKILISLNEASELTGLSKSTLYKLTSQRKVSFFKPFGKKIFFTKDQLEEMMKQNLKRSVASIEKEATDLIMVPKKRKDD